MRVMKYEYRPMTEDERALLNHVSMWGSSGYPVQKVGRSWQWRDWRSVRGAPTTWKTKREAVAAFERFYDMLLEFSGEESYRRAMAEAANSSAMLTS
jgi:hypothetical protein